LNQKLGLGAGAAARFAKAPAGIFISLSETKGFPQREAEGLRPPPAPWKDHRFMVLQSPARFPVPASASKHGSQLKFLTIEPGIKGKFGLDISNAPK
jgi:hypothetical protein